MPGITNNSLAWIPCAIRPYYTDCVGSIFQEFTKLRSNVVLKVLIFLNVQIKNVHAMKIKAIDIANMGNNIIQIWHWVEYHMTVYGSYMGLSYFRIQIYKRTISSYIQ